jgi:hypothetical protein
VKVVSFLWKAPVVAAAVILGAIAANQVGWSGADLVLNTPLMGGLEQEITRLFFLVGSAVAGGTLWVVYRLARPALWVLVPLMAYSALVPGAWNGIVSDFDTIRGEAIRHHAANAYALQHMSPRGLYLSCEDQRIELTEDGEAYCKSALSVAPGERVPGTEHKCGLLGMFSCFYTKAKPSAEALPAPCKNRAASCEPWERDWSKSDLTPGSIVTKEGTIQPPR